MTSVRLSSSALPTRFVIHQNYPNPFNPTTTIQYALPHRSQVTLTVYNMLGQEIATPVNDEIEAGYHSAQSEVAGLASGVYFYKLHAGSYVDTKNIAREVMFHNIDEVPRRPQITGCRPSFCPRSF